MSNNIINRFRGDYHFLSNFWACRITYGGAVYYSSEAAFQAQKCANESDKVRFSGITDPAVAKSLGRRIKSVSNWNEIRVAEMYQVLVAKFTQNEELKAKLLATGDAELVEGNDWGDTFWGVCKGVGENMLGKLLMEVREQLRGV